MKDKYFADKELYDGLAKQISHNDRIINDMKLDSERTYERDFGDHRMFVHYSPNKESYKLTFDEAGGETDIHLSYRDAKFLVKTFRLKAIPKSGEGYD